MMAHWVAVDAELEIVHFGDYVKTDEQGRSITLCGQRFWISPIDGLLLDKRAAHVTCTGCLAILDRRVTSRLKAPDLG